MSIVTKKGDGGYTDFPDYENSGGGKRVRKDDPRVECLGALDELDAFLALAEIALQSGGSPRFADIVAQARETLFSAVLPAIMPAAHSTAARELIVNTERLEQHIAELEQENPFRGFVRSWTKPAAAALNIARTVCRRCERRMVSAAEHRAGGETTQNQALQWTNRLSDLLFLLAVSEEKNSGA